MSGRVAGKNGFAKAGWCSLVFLLCVLVARGALAHDFDPGVLVVAEQQTTTETTRFRVRLAQPTDTRKVEASTRLRLPRGCSWDRADDRTDIVCTKGTDLARSMVSFEGLTTPRGPRRMLVTFRPKEGPAFDQVIVDESPFRLSQADRETSSAADERSSGFGAFVRLGAEHLLAGPDHLAFLVGLVALVRDRKSLFLAITAFSLGHALSLGLSVSGLVHVPTAPTEALIAISVALVAREALAQRAATSDGAQPPDAPPTVLHRAPFVASLLFGLVHGLGFASALGDRGFPQAGLWRALAAFHLGIEGAQLLVVGCLGAAVWALQAMPPAAQILPRLRSFGLYALGCLGAAWSIDRVASLLSGG